MIVSLDGVGGPLAANIVAMTNTAPVSSRPVEIGQQGCNPFFGLGQARPYLADLASEVGQFAAHLGKPSVDTYLLRGSVGGLDDGCGTCASADQALRSEDPNCLTNCVRGSAKGAPELSVAGKFVSRFELARDDLLA